MKIEAQWQNGMHFKCTGPSGHTVDVDSGPEGKTEGSSPMELLLNSVACCSGIDVVLILQKKRKEPESLDVTVEGIRSEEHPRKFTEIKLHFSVKHKSVTKEEMEQAIDLSIDKYCSAIATITPTAKISYDYTINN